MGNRQLYQSCDSLASPKKWFTGVLVPCTTLDGWHMRQDHACLAPDLLMPAMRLAQGVESRPKPANCASSRNGESWSRIRAIRSRAARLVSVNMASDSSTKERKIDQEAGLWTDGAAGAQHCSLHTHILATLRIFARLEPMPSVFR